MFLLTTTPHLHQVEVLACVTFLCMFIGKLPATNAQPQLDKRCGQEVAGTQQYSGKFWIASLYNDGNSVIQREIQDSAMIMSVISTKQLNDKGVLLLPYDFRLSADSKSVSYFVSGVNDRLYREVGPSELKIATDDGKVFSYTIPRGEKWWQIGPELSPGTWGVLAEGDNFAAVLLEVSLTGESIAVKLLRPLPFQLAVLGSAWQYKVFVSPDWSYLAYHQDSQLHIYSLKAATQVAATNANIPTGIIWLDKGNLLGLVVQYGSGTKGNIISLDQSGTMKELVDFRSLLGDKDVTISSHTHYGNGAGEVVVQVQYNGRNGGKNLLVNTLTGEVWDFCLDFVRVPPILIGWVAGGTHIAFQVGGWDETTGLFTSRLLVLELATGNYTYMPLDFDGKPVQVVAWSSN